MTGMLSDDRGSVGMTVESVRMNGGRETCRTLQERHQAGMTVGSVGMTWKS
jgi:hypothetical protein